MVDAGPSWDTQESWSRPGSLLSSSSPPGCVSLGIGQRPSGPLDPKLFDLVQNPDPSGQGGVWKRPCFLNTVQRVDGVAGSVGHPASPHLAHSQGPAAPKRSRPCSHGGSVWPVGWGGLTLPGWSQPLCAATMVAVASALSSSFWKSPAPQPWCLVLQESFSLSQTPSDSPGGAAPQSEDARWTHWSSGPSTPQCI